jgi:hypothetical protein
MSLVMDMIRTDVRRAKSAARREFREHYPIQRIAKVMLRAEEDTRFVVGVFYGDTIPPRYKFYAVDKHTGEVSLIEDPLPYRLPRQH